MRVIPSISQIYTGIKTSLETAFSIIIPTDEKNFLYGLTGTWATQIKTLFNYNASTQKNIWYDTADPESQGGTLERFGRTFILRDPYPATQGEYVCNVTGSAGAVIEALTQFTSDDTSLSPGFIYQLDTTYVLTGTGDTITVRSLTAGNIAKLAVGNTLTCTIPLINVSNSIEVASVAVSPIDAETTEQYRRAIDIGQRISPLGGAAGDYRIWGSEVAGVANIYPYTASGAVWQVNVFVEAFPADSTDGYGTPGTPMLNSVRDHILNDPITGRERKPMGVQLGNPYARVYPIAVKQITIQFSGAGSISADNQTLIKSALIEAVNGIRPFIAGIDDLALQNDSISVGLPATTGSLAPPEKYVIIVIAMQAAPGAIFTGASMTVGGTPYSSYQFLDGEIPFLQSVNVTFVP